MTDEDTRIRKLRKEVEAWENPKKKAKRGLMATAIEAIEYAANLEAEQAHLLDVLSTIGERTTEADVNDMCVRALRLNEQGNAMERVRREAKLNLDCCGATHYDDCHLLAEADDQRNDEDEAFTDLWEDLTGGS